ncbi:MAG TPA: hypothetical protein VGK94_12300 [Candidatus Polarisedimenticolia bacterium]
MREDLSGPAREGAALRAHRSRVAGAAMIGLAVLAWWTGRMAGLW